MVHHVNAYPATAERTGRLGVKERNHFSRKEIAMSAKSFCTLAAAIFALVALLQFARAALGWPVSVGGFTVPLAASWIAFVVMATLSVLGFRAAR
jgi:hypothetical protein